MRFFSKGGHSTQNPSMSVIGIFRQLTCGFIASELPINQELPASLRHPAIYSAAAGTLAASSDFNLSFIHQGLSWKIVPQLEEPPKSAVPYIV